MIDKLKSLSKDTLIYGISTVISRSLSFLLVPFYTRIFPVNDFGYISTIFSYIAILNVIFSLGLESGYFKFSSTLEVGTKEENFTHPFLAVTLNSFLLSTILFFSPVFFAGVFQIPENYSYLLKFTALILFFDALTLIPFAKLRLERKSKKFGIIKIINIIVNVSMNFLLVFYFKMGIEAVLIANLIASIVTFLILFPIVTKNFTAKFNKILTKELFFFSLPVLPSGISLNIIQVIDRPIMLFLAGSTMVGIYQANYRLGVFMMLFVGVFDFAWRPFFLSNANSPDAKQLFSKVMTLFILAGTVIFLTLSVFLDEIILLIGKNYRSGSFIVPVVLFAYLFNGIYINLMAGIYIKKKTKHVAIVTFIAAAANVIFNFTLIPLMGMMGAALATLISYLIMAGGLYIYSQKNYPVQYEIKKIVLIFISVLSIYGAFSLISNYILIPFYFKIFFVLIYLFMIFGFKILDINNIKRMISAKA
ncbi:oligosaccharide flippase family protein [soil metagenome]